MEQSEKGKRKNPFGDLGRPTLRGVRKCHKCGTYNGTRGIICKNKQCDVVFKERERKKGHSADAVKITTGSTSQLYSVRQRDRGPDYRAFVQLPYIQDVDGNPTSMYDTSILIQASLCFVDRCQPRNSPDADGIIKSFASNSDGCIHIRSAINCTQEAQPLGLKSTILDNLQVTNEMKHAIWLLATETSGPVVQRVTKSIMVVKCKVTAKQPFGFLHCAFYETVRKRQHPEYKFQCMCRAFKVRNTNAINDGMRHCVHYYACVCAFASDEKLAVEFSHYLTTDPCLAITPLPISVDPTEAGVPNESTDLSLYQEVDETLSHVAATDTDTMEVIISDDILVSSTHIDKSLKKDESLVEVSNSLVNLQEQSNISVSSPVNLLSTPVSLLSTLHSNGEDSICLKESAQQQQAPQLMQFQIATQTRPVETQAAVAALSQSSQTVATVIPQGITKLTPSTTRKTATHSGALAEFSTTFSFQQWLTSVTERINQTMHYGFSGTPDPLVFHAPQVFFECLQQRISAGSRKKRLPNFTTGFVRKEALPLGSFTKYTWHITNIAQIKQIFDTPEISLELTRTFMENRRGNFELYDPPQVNTISDKLKHHTPIRPFELKTFLKVGITNENKQPTPFVIEWIPDILPRSHIGELRIKFEFGHKRNGQIEKINAKTNTVSSSAVDLNLQPQTVQLRKISPS